MNKNEAFTLADEIADRAGADVVRGFSTRSSSHVQFARERDVQADEYLYSVVVSNVTGDLIEIKGRHEWQAIAQQYEALKEWRMARKRRKDTALTTSPSVSSDEDDPFSGYLFRD